MSTITAPLYHERQAFGRQLCAVHALNALARAPTCSSADFFAVARKLAGGGAQASRLLGNFDANVLMAAAQEHAGLELSYFDARRVEKGEALEELFLSAEETSGGGGATTTAGLVLNVPISGWWGRLRGARHWLALVPVAAAAAEDAVVWYNCDSMLAAPERLGEAREAAAWLRARMGAAPGGATLLVARRLGERGVGEEVK